MSNIPLESVPDALQKHFSLHGVTLCHKETYCGHPIFIGDGVKTPKEAREEFKGLKVVDDIVPGPGERSRDDLWMRDGYFVTAFGFLRGKAVIGFPLYFAYDHDLDVFGHNSESRRDARVNSALYAAKDAMDAMMHVGLLENPVMKPQIWTPYAQAY